MSTSILYHGFGIRGYRCVTSTFLHGAVQLHIERAAEDLRCPDCMGADLILRGVKQRVFRTVPIGRHPVTVHLRHQRVQCRECGALRWYRIGFAEGTRRHTRALARYILELSRHMSMGAAPRTARARITADRQNSGGHGAECSLRA